MISPWKFNDASEIFGEIIRRYVTITSSRNCPKRNVAAGFHNDEIRSENQTNKKLEKRQKAIRLIGLDKRFGVAFHNIFGWCSGCCNGLYERMILKQLSDKVKLVKQYLVNTKNCVLIFY